LSVLTTNIDRNQSGTSLVETVVAFGILSAVVLVFLGGLITSLNGTLTAREQGIAESLARNELEYIKSVSYSATGYPVNDNLSLPEGWTLPEPLVEPVNAGLQKITVITEHNGVPVLSISTYKMSR